MKTRYIALFGGVLALILLTIQNFSASVWRPSLDIQFVLLVGGIIGVAWGLAQPSSPQDSDARIPVMIGGIALLGLVLRLWQLETSVHYFVDELNFAEGISDIIRARE